MSPKQNPTPMKTLDQLKVEIFNGKEPVLQADPLLITGPHLKQLASELAAQAIFCADIEVRPDATMSEILQEIGQKFKFPSYFGHNEDALVDCWSDMSWLDSKKYVCILHAQKAKAELSANQNDVLDRLSSIALDIFARQQDSPPQRGSPAQPNLFLIIA